METKDRRHAEIDLLAVAVPSAKLDPESRWLTLDAHPLGEGWNVDSTPVLIEIPVGYPTTPPDNLCVRADLRLTNGAMPASTMGVRDIDGRAWLQFSYHIESSDWRPHAELATSDTLATYLVGALRRLEEPS